MQLYLIRHAESQNNARPAHERVEDPPITAVGRLQAAALADWLTTLRIDHLITSPFLRTLQTTRYVVDAKPIPVQVWHDVFERGGCFRGHGPDAVQGGMGLGRSDVVRHLTDDPSRCTVDDSIDEQGWWGGRDRETDQQALVRAAGVVERLAQRFGGRGETVVLIIHADFKRALLAQMLAPASATGNVGADAASFGALRNVGISKVDFDGSRWQLDWFNSVTHMPARLITGNET